MIRYLKYQQNTPLSDKENTFISIYLEKHYLAFQYLIGYRNYDFDRRVWVKTFENEFRSESLWGYRRFNFDNKHQVLELVNRLRPRMLECEWVSLRKEVRKQLNLSKEKDWYEAMDENIVVWVRGIIKVASKNLSCVDNYRASKIGNPTQYKRYIKAKNRGCCGFYDKVHKCPIDNRNYIIGFNYGH